MLNYYCFFLAAPFLLFVRVQLLIIVIEEANWLTLYDDIEHLIGNGFDAVICLGNSFAHMLDSYGDQREQKLAIKNFERCVRPGGLLIIDHRNYDSIMDTGSTPVKNIYYNVSRTLYTHKTLTEKCVQFITAAFFCFGLFIVITIANAR